VPLNETIAAIATAPGKAAIAIVRVSGPATLELAMRILTPKHPLRPRYASLRRIHDAEGRLIDEGLALFFAAPASATGEDVLELQLHGSPLVAELTLNAAIAAGARLAQPGEFTKRAFLAGKLDLSAAESVADLIDAEHHSAARAAAGRLAGALARSVQRERAALMILLEELAASIDFPDEVHEPARDLFLAHLQAIRGHVAELIAGGSLGRLVREGATVALAGPPNAGKSSLLNAFLGDDRAIVSEIAGTTRDTIEEQADCDGLLVRLIDTAGIRPSVDALEAAGIERSRKTLEQARIILVVLDGAQPLDRTAREVLAVTRDRERIIYLNKADLGLRQAVVEEVSQSEVGVLSGSAHEPATIARLRAALRERLLGATADLERPHLARAREIDAATEALHALDLAIAGASADEPLDFVSGDLVAASAALGRITGDTVNEEVLTGIFARFCIGK
jgi:tRNA modification GTPase